MLSVGPGDEFTNAYPLFASRSIYEGQRATSPDKRVVTLTRSAFPGQQRYAAAAWSGDINGAWETFGRQIPAGLNFCLTGMPYWTTDCAGFFHPKDQYRSADFNELLTRWFQWSTFCPILRVHGYQTETEIWKWLPETQKHLLAYDRLRYRMLPYTYTLAARVTFQADTIMRALGMDFPGDPKAWDISDEYLFGPAILVAPVTRPQPRAATFISRPERVGWTSGPGAARKATDAFRRRAARHDPAFCARRFHRALRSRAAIRQRENPPTPSNCASILAPMDPSRSTRTKAMATVTRKAASPRSRSHGTTGRKPSPSAHARRIPGMLKTRTFRVVLVRDGHGTGDQFGGKPDAEVRYQGQPLKISLQGR